MQDFRDLKVWQKSHQLTLQIYQHNQFQPILLKDVEEKVDEILRGFFKLPWGQLRKWNI